MHIKLRKVKTYIHKYLQAIAAQAVFQNEVGRSSYKIVSYALVFGVTLSYGMEYRTVLLRDEDK